MQAIRTKYIGPTNVRGSRVKASCQAKSRIFTWDDSLNPAGNHREAARKLATELGWNYGEWVGGDLPDGSTVWVCNSKASEAFEVDDDPPETSYEAEAIDRAIEADKEDGVKPGPRKAYLVSLRNG